MNLCKWLRYGRLLAGMALLWALLAACSSPLATLSSSQTPDCYLQPQPTGEKIVPPTVVATPPAQARPGQVLHLRFSGGYVALNNARICGGEIVGYIHDDELPTPRVMCKFTLRLNEQMLASGDRCPPECEVQFTIPEDILPGRYQLSLWTPWGESAVFDIEIMRAGTTAP